jgi:hypothetical protein
VKALDHDSKSLGEHVPLENGTKYACRGQKIVIFHFSKNNPHVRARPWPLRTSFRQRRLQKEQRVRFNGQYDNRKALASPEAFVFRNRKVGLVSRTRAGNGENNSNFALLILVSNLRQASFGISQGNLRSVHVVGNLTDGLIALRTFGGRTQPRSGSTLPYREFYALQSVLSFFPQCI